MTDSPVALPHPGVLCPHCGYDLRATIVERCSECGHAFDPATLAVSRIPWVHRKELGNIRAWWRTMQFVTGSPRKFAGEITLPVSWRDASRFRWVTLLIAALFMGTALSILYPWLYLSTFQADYPYMVEASEPVRVLLKWGYPAVALWTGPGILIVITASIVVAGGCVSWWTRLCFWIVANDAKGRASALSCYLAAWIVPIVFLTVADIMISIFYFSLGDWNWVVVSLLLGAHIFVAASLSFSLFFLIARAARGNIARIICGLTLIVLGNCIATLLAVGATSIVLGAAAVMLKTLGN